MEGKTFECPNCGGVVSYDPNTGKLICPFCKTIYNSKDLFKYKKELSPSEEDELFSDLDSFSEYACEACGASIVGSKEMVSTTCPYCGNNLLFKESMTGKYKPKYILPIKSTKEEAKRALLYYLSTKSFIPRDLKKQISNSTLTPIYIPFYLFSGVVDFKASLLDEKINQVAASKFHISPFECSLLDITVEFKNMPIDALIEIDNDTMDSICSYEDIELIPFTTSYMAGYLSKKANDRFDNMKERAENRLKEGCEQNFREILNCHQKEGLSIYDFEISGMRKVYALLPFWIINTPYKGKNVQSIVNDQTKEAYTITPIDSTKLALVCIAVAILFFLLFYGVGYLIYKSIIAGIIFGTIFAPLAPIIICEAEKGKPNHGVRKHIFLDDAKVRPQGEKKEKEKNDTPIIETKQKDSLLNQVIQFEKNQEQNDVLMKKGALSPDAIDQRLAEFKREKKNLLAALNGLNEDIVIRAKNEMKNMTIGQIDFELDRVNATFERQMNELKRNHVSDEFLSIEIKHKDWLILLYNAQYLWNNKNACINALIAQKKKINQLELLASKGALDYDALVKEKNKFNANVVDAIDSLKEFNASLLKQEEDFIKNYKGNESKESLEQLINSFEQSIHTCEIEGIPSEIKDNEVKYKDQFKEMYTSILKED